MKGFWDQELDLDNIPEVSDRDVIDAIKGVPTHYGTQSLAGVTTGLKYTTGGFFAGCFYSGAVVPSVLGCPNAFAVGSDVMVFSGPGRLDSVVIHASDAAGSSGLQLGIPFYDAAAPVSGGPIPASGHRIVYRTQQYVQPISGQGAPGQLLSGNLPSQFAGPGVYAVGQHFSSGLCFNSRSGQPAFTVNWTPEDQ